MNPDKTVVLWEITLNNLLADGEIDEQDFLDRAEILYGLGQTVLVQNYQNTQTSRLFWSILENLARISFGVDNLSELFQDKYYRDLQGGTIGAFGRIFSKDLKILVYHSSTIQHPT